MLYLFHWNNSELKFHQTPISLFDDNSIIIAHNGKFPLYVKIMEK